MNQRSEDAKVGSITRFVEEHGKLLALGVVAVGLALRLSGFFGWWLNPDEGIYYSTVTQVSVRNFWTEVGFQAHPPLYFVILRGVGSLTKTFAGLRCVALVSGCVAIYAFVLAGREMGGPGARGWLTGLTSGLLLAVSPRAIALSQLIRPYMFLVALLACALYALLRYLRQPRAGLLVMYAACATAAVLTHYSAMLALGAMGVLVIVDGARRGFARPEWLRLLAIQVVPALTIVTLYVVHLRNLMSLAGAENATEGWLGAYMIRGVGDAWLSMMGFHSMLVGEALAASAALLTLAALGLAVWRRAWTTLTIGAAGMLIAAAAAAAVLYPFGATRHTAWLLVFVTPVLAWVLTMMFTSGRRLAGVSAVVLAGLWLGGGSGLGGLLGADSMPPEISEHVLQQGHLDAMSEALDPQAAPSVVFMSTETYQLLMPLYTSEREAARRSSDGVLLHFEWGTRDVIVIPTRDFTALPDQVGYPNHLYTVAQKAAVDFPSIGLEHVNSILVLAGGWRSQGMSDLADMAGGTESLGSTLSVPGLIAVELDMAAYVRVLLGDQP